MYPNEQLEMVMDAHEQAFKFFAGCCKNDIYDNMKTAVKKILKGKDRIFNEKFAQMASHHLFEPLACTPASGWEKGQVEKQVGDSRRNFFTPILKGDSYEAINTKLREMSIEWAKTKRHPEFTEKTILEIYEEEKEYLIRYRGQFTGCRLHPTIVSPLSLIGYDSNMYSVPCEYVGLSVSIKSYAWQIVILHESKIIAEHVRCFKRYQKIYNPWHYITALERKPGALRNGAPFKELMSLLPEIFGKLRNKLETYKDGDKQFIDILLFVNKHGLEKVTNACNLAIAAGGCSSKLVEQYLQRPVMKLDIQDTEFIQLKNPPDADCSIYSKLYLTTEGS